MVEKNKVNKVKVQGQSPVEAAVLNIESEEMKKLKAELEASNKALAEEKKKSKYKAEQVPVPKEQLELPKGMQEAETKTVVRDMSSIIEEKMIQLKDMATMEVLLPSNVRMQNRLKSVKELGSAYSIKVRGIWKTTPPKMHIAKLEGKKVSNGEFQITFGVYECDDKGEKKLYTQYAEVLMHDGSRINRPTSAEYRVAYEVVETIKEGKALTREVVRIGGN